MAKSDSRFGEFKSEMDSKYTGQTKNNKRKNSRIEKYIKELPFGKGVKKKSFNKSTKAVRGASEDRVTKRRYEQNNANKKQRDKKKAQYLT